jgi:hypothetical protein
LTASCDLQFTGFQFAERKMKWPDYDDPAIEERWCKKQRANVARYLRSQNVKHGRIGDWPAWHVAPFVSIWAIESVARPEWIGWWVISGDLPTDYISAADVKPPQHPRKAIRVIARKWLKVVKAWKKGREHNDIGIGDRQSHKELAPLLEVRARALIKSADNSSLWEGE